MGVDERPAEVAGGRGGAVDGGERSHRLVRAAAAGAGAGGGGRVRDRASRRDARGRACVREGMRV
jgi:hypothetical protein